jgi:N-hydroxyarylamine O-acetyltransferase
MTGSPPFDVGAYLSRIGYRGALEPAFPTLAAVHAAHLSRIPFENIDVRLRRPIAIDPESLQAKLVRGGRGGYCFEQNGLFAGALGALGFHVTTLEARVRPPDATAVLPRTHMTLRVDVGGRAWLADVGFGGDGPLLPVPLDGAVAEQPGCAYRIEREGDAIRVLRRRWRGAWEDLYAFSLTPALQVDYEVANHFTSTHPRSAFLKTLTVQRVEGPIRRILRGRAYTVRAGDEESVREISAGELPELLRREFGLEIPDEDVRRALGDG